MSKQNVCVVWFKRDLRISDHQPLHDAAKKGIVIPLYVVERELWQQPDMSERHYLFLVESLRELSQQLDAIGQPLVIRVGNVIDVLSELSQTFNVEGVWSHQETWNGWTYERDKAFGRWLKAQGIPWYESQYNGVIRVLPSRDGWASRWKQTMTKRCVDTPTVLGSVDVTSDELPTAGKLGLSPDNCIGRQTGGRRIALETLKSFLYERGEGYTKLMSAPAPAFDACSRLSPYFAFGCISVREVYQAKEQRRRELYAMPKEARGYWLSALKSFSSRLHWRCHFMQKLEDEPALEFENLHPGYNTLRNNTFNEEWFEAWQEGRTGYPMIDACMRSLIATGWLNFRMRAMLMSFASYHLWLHWRKPSLYLARLFTDYEPGIHYSQVQMQSGTTGINTPRIYNPIKQGFDHDADAEFITRWCPELEILEPSMRHTPWEANISPDIYPKPIVDEKEARKHAASKIFACHKSAEHKQIARTIVTKHASRKPNR